MRDIKFRVFDKKIPKTQEATELKNPSGMIVDWEYVKESSYLKDGINGKYPIMQYTGIKDKNGKDVYEGDIVELIDAYNCKDIGKVVFYSDNASFCIKGEEKYWEFLELAILRTKIEIIGNIFENPELLEQAE